MFNFVHMHASFRISMHVFSKPYNHVFATISISEAS